MAGRRHKGAKPVDFSQFYQPYGLGHCVARSIATGTRWIDAWQFQYAPGGKLHGGRGMVGKVTGIDRDRWDALRLGATVTMREVTALADAYGVQPHDIIASLPDPRLLEPD